MGMYDELHIDKKYLPDNLKVNEAGWQTKSYECLLLTLNITESGKLLVVKTDDLDGEKIEEVNYTGSIIFYNFINKIWHEFIAEFENGQMLKLVQVAPLKVKESLPEHKCKNCGDEIEHR